MRVLAGVSIAAGATSTLKVTGVGTVPATGVSAVSVNLAAAGASAAGALIVYPSDLAAAPAVTGSRYRSGVWENQSMVVKTGSDGQIKVKNTGSAAVSVYADIDGYFTGQAGASAGATFVPLDPARIISNQSVAADSTATFTVVGAGGIPVTDVAFVSFTLIVKSAGSGKITLYPSGTAKPAMADMNYRPSAYMSNLAIVAPGTDGKIAVNNSGTSPVAVYVDIDGYFVAPRSATAGSAAIPVAPSRIVSGTSVAAGATYTVAPLGQAGVPTGLVSAVAVNLTAKGTAAGALVIYPSGQANPPTAGSVQYQASDFWANVVLAKLGADGRFVVKNTGSAAITLSVDTFAYFRTPGPPLAPTAVTATPGDAGATVTWTAPSDGGAPITAYTVTAGPGGARASSTGATTATVTGLTNGTAYTFTVTATNAIGTSAASAPSAAVTPHAAVSRPGAPLGVTATAGDGVATVTWQAPSSGGSPITKYTMTAIPGGTTTTTTGTTTTVSGLTNGTAYTFTVTATNAIGTSDASAPSPPVTPGRAVPPGRPFVTEVEPRDSAVQVGWAPQGNGATVTEYVVTASPGGANVRITAPETTAIVGGLVNGTSYRFTVAAVNSAGTGEASWPSDPVVPVPAAVPLKPVAMQVFSGDRTLDVQWVAPLDGGSPITGYTVTLSPGGTIVRLPAGTTVTRVAGLTNGTAYTVSVVADNAAGSSDAAISDPVTPAAVRAPAAPTHVVAAASANGAFTVSWQPPIDAGTSAITSYTVTAGPGGKTVTSTTTSATITGLAPATGYTLTVTATSAAGVSAPSVATDPLYPARGIKQAPLVLSNADLATLRAVHSDGTLIFDQPPAEIAALTTGMIIYGPVTAMLPQGFLGRVFQVTKQNGLFIVTTTTAALADVFSDGDMWMDVPLDSGDMTFVPTGPGVRVVAPTVNGEAVRALGRGTVAGGPTVGWRNGGIVLEISQKFESGGKPPMNAAIEAQGELKPHPKFHARLNGSNPYVDFGLTGDVSFELRGKVGFTAEVSPPARELGFIEGPCFPVAEYTVLCLRANAKLKFEADGSVGVTVAASWKRTVGMTCHVSSATSSCDGVNTGEGLSLPKAVEAYGDANVTVSVPMDMQFLIDHVVGPAPTIAPYLQFKADTTQDPWWEIRLGAKIGIAVDLVVIEKDFSPYRNDDLKDYFVTLASGGPFWGLQIVPQNGTTTVRLPYTFGYKVSHYPDDVPVTWSVKDDTSATIDAHGQFLSDHPGAFTVKADAAQSGAHPALHAQAGMTVGGIFGAPTPPTIDDTRWSHPTVGGIAVSWRPPADAGASALTGYVIVAQATGSTHVPSPITTAYADGDATHQLIQGLAPGTTYVVSVIARNSSGSSAPSEPSALAPLDVTFPGPPSTLGADLASSTETTGRPDSTGAAGGFGGGSMSGDGQYIVFETQGRSNLMPHDSPYYNPASKYTYVIRKKATGAGGGSVVASIEPNGQPSYNMYTDPLISRDGNVVAYTGFSYASPTISRGVVRDIAAGTSWTTEDNGLIGGVSDNGQVVVYWKSAPGQASDLYRQARGASPQKLSDCTGTSGPRCPLTVASRAILSGDGNRVVWSTLDDANVGHSWLYDATTGATTEIFPGSGVVAPLISGDGQVATFSYRSLTSSMPCVVVMRLSGAAPTDADCRITDTGSTRAQAIFLSKDGRVFAYRYTEFAGGRGRTSLRVYFGTGTSHIAGGSPDTWPTIAFITDDNAQLVYSLWHETFQGSVYTATTVPGLWLDYTN
ncbi:fibronectin type III domain-containing protein [Sphaerisporangium corydalis]|uniref:Fibronectin type III domain-containing protein n=1 Tax=Sphaerisporangium corydalis TaxID=1441875 RepID=A0ABV9EQT4_9ACTN|nr:fibronectin type III domain-containing protein [Sphaerisporangium corydalis]